MVWCLAACTPTALVRAASEPVAEPVAEAEHVAKAEPVAQPAEPAEPAEPAGAEPAELAEPAEPAEPARAEPSGAEPAGAGAGAEPAPAPVGTFVGTLARCNWEQQALMAAVERYWGVGAEEWSYERWGDGSWRSQVQLD